MSDWNLEEISRRIVYLELRARQRMAEWLGLVAEFDARGGARGVGHRGTAEWLAYACGIDGRTAREHVRVARRLAQLPAVAEAFAVGRLSYSQVRAISRAAETEDEHSLLEVALTSTANELERHVRQLRSSASADLDVANHGRARRFVKHFWDEDGSLRFFGRLAADDGAAFVEAIEARTAVIHGQDDDPCCAEGWPRPPLGARRADALVELVTGGGAQTHVILHADLAALACSAERDQPRGGDVLFLSDGPAIPSELARRLACDATVSVRGLDQGRSTRTISRRQRRALEDRDGRRCAMPGCDRAHGLEGHHITPWSLGGRTDLNNLVLLCRYHHRLFHDDRFHLRREPDGTLTIHDPAGRELANRAPPPAYAVAA